MPAGKSNGMSGRLLFKLPYHYHLRLFSPIFLSSPVGYRMMRWGRDLLSPPTNNAQIGKKSQTVYFI
jgi:hypothetical protein